MTDGAAMIAGERKRQVESEGFTADHDDRHQRNLLAYAAEGYLRAARVTGCGYRIDSFREYPNIPIEWPTEWLDRWKPSNDTIRNLVKAGALIAAEIDRLQRQAS